MFQNKSQWIRRQKLYQAFFWQQHFCSVIELWLFFTPWRVLQHTRFPCPSLSPWVCPDSCPLNQWHHWLSDVIQPSHPLSSPSPLALNLSQHQGLFQWVSSSHQLAKVLELLLQHQSFQWIFRVDCLLDWQVWSPYSPRDCQISSQHHNLKASILLHTAFFMVQLSHLYMTTRKTIPLTIQNFVSKVMSLAFYMLSRFVKAFLPRRNCLLISCLQSQYTLILESKNRKSGMFPWFPIYLPWSDRTGCHDLCFLNIEFQVNNFTLLFQLHQEALCFIFTFCH